jgi:glutathione S-transferase
MLSVWGRKSSSNVQAVMWCIAELGLDYRRHDVGHSYGGNDTPAFLAMNPNGTIPVLRDGDGPPLWESAAILRYLCGRYAAPSFRPADPIARAEVDMWAEWAKINVTLSFTVPIFWRVVRTAPGDVDWSKVRQAILRLAKILDIAEARLASRQFLCGDALTLADIQFGHILYRCFDLRIERPSHPAIKRYYEGLMSRAPYREHVMVSYAELRAS